MEYDIEKLKEEFYDWGLSVLDEYAPNKKENSTNQNIENAVKLGDLNKAIEDKIRQISEDNKIDFDELNGHLYRTGQSINFSFCDKFGLIL